VDYAGSNSSTGLPSGSSDPGVPRPAVLHSPCHRASPGATTGAIRTAGTRPSSTAPAEEGRNVGSARPTKEERRSAGYSSAARGKIAVSADGSVPDGGHVQLMIRMKEMDEAVTLREQMGLDAGPVVLINTFTVQPGEVDQLLRAWAADAAFFKRQPGFISAQ